MLHKMTNHDIHNFSCANTSRNCLEIGVNLSHILSHDELDKHPMASFGWTFYAYVTPVIIVIGLLGNGVSLCVFLSKSLRQMSASRYLASLSIADISTLIFYVLGEWLQRGLDHFSFGSRVDIFDFDGVCKCWLFFNYLSRFMSAWLIVCFTGERFLGVCMPLHRRNLGSLKQTNRIIAILFVVASLLVMFKPFLSGVRTVRNRTACASKQEVVYESFVLDTIYGLLITLVPFCIISSLNILIIKKLISRRKRRSHHFATEEGHIRLEFTSVLLVISFCFIALNLPFFIMWFRNFHYSEKQGNVVFEGDDPSLDYWIGVLYITRTIFYINYCINFFLYSITGTIFRKELRVLFFRKSNQYETCVHSNHTHHFKYSHDLRANSCV